MMIYFGDGIRDFIERELADRKASSDAFTRSIREAVARHSAKLKADESVVPAVGIPQ